MRKAQIDNFDGILNGYQIGFEVGVQQQKLESIRSLMRTLSFTAEQAMDALQIPTEDHQSTLDVLNLYQYLK